jgi:glycosyltransferase involved in cell wall biosynthesis
VIEIKDILFIGLGKTPQAWYRCFLPALHMHADWVGVQGDPPQPIIVTGLVKDRTAIPVYDDYKVIVIQQPMGRKWLGQIRRLQERGVKVVFEIDDYLHGVRKQEDHDFAKAFDKKTLKEFEICMRACDAMTCSTEYLASRYRSFNQNVHVIENGLDMARYRLTRPERETINIGWAGATGHSKPLTQWVPAIAKVMARHPEVCFVSVGRASYAIPFQQKFGERRAIGIPFTCIENYPAAMTMFDIAIAPAGQTSWYKAKSDLRWLEAGALGVPIIAQKSVTYDKIVHGEDGFVADTPQEAEEYMELLVAEEKLRRRVGAAAKDYVARERDVSVMHPKWFEALGAIAGGYESMARV